MLSLLGAWAILLIVCCTIGTGIMNGLNAFSFERRGDRLLLAAWLGLVLLATGLLTISLLVPLSPLVGLGVAAALCGISLRSSATRREIKDWYDLLSWRKFLFLMPLAVGVAAIMSHPVTWIDTGLYHYSVIQWLSQFGAVPGLALLFNNFAFTSSWFALAAPFNAGISTAQMITVASGFTLLLVGCHFCLGVVRSVHSQAQISDWFVMSYFGVLGFLITVVHSHRQLLISPSPDLPTAFLIGAIAWAVIIMANTQNTSSQNTSSQKLPFFSEAFIPLILAAGTVTIKLIALPILAVSLLMFVVVQKDWRKAMAGGILSGLMLLPLMVHSTITSACPLFPSTAICFALPWLPLAKDAKTISDSTHNWVSWYQPPPHVNPWLWGLWHWLLDAKINPILAAFSVLSVFAVLFFLRKPVFKYFSGQVWLILSGLGGIAFIMKTAPSSRFLLPYSILLPSVAIALYCHTHFKTSLPLPTAQLKRGLMLLPLFSIAVITILVIHLSLPLLLPPHLKNVPITQKKTNDIVYRSPIDPEMCWSTRIPCAFEVPDEVKLRRPDQGIRAGFTNK